MASITQEARNDEKLAELVAKWKNIFRDRGGSRGGGEGELWVCKNAGGGASDIRQP
jgi:hypothetical protein